MKYSKRYIVFTLALAVIFIFKFQVFGVDRGDVGQFRGGYLDAGVWSPLVAGGVNKKTIFLL